MTAKAKTRFSRRSVAAVVVAALLLVLVSAASLADAWSRDDAERAQTAGATPVVATAEPEDPLDGDPLDGEPEKDADAPDEMRQFAIERSGRPSGSPNSLPAYDGDPESLWVPDEDEENPWLWLDLGEERRLRQVRWLADGDGVVDVAISNDRRRWEEVASVDVGAGWQGVDLRDDARYVRLTLTGAADEAAPSIAEVSVFGRGGEDVSLEQKADEDGKDKKKDDKKDREKEKDSGKGNDDKSGGGRSNMQAEAGDTRCKGDKGRCRAREGRIVMEEDCEEEGSCTIDVQVDGGTAICDATGGNEARAGRGKGKEGGEGGRCEAIADGGVVTIGDINP